ncbi:MAG: hypothetical protein K2Y30_01975 [Flavobacteriaceae bacterium]|nr:hypothetical protein [Flavobacteriaceae bacterium]
MRKFEFTQPDFLFCEIVIKDDSPNDHRIWIFHRKSLSLIEFINVDDFKDFEFTGKQDRFEYLDENWFGVFVQNNCEATEHNADQVLAAAWKYLEDYFIWEDSQEEE